MMQAVTIKEFEDYYEVEGPGVVWVSGSDLDGEKFVKSVSSLFLEPFTPKPLYWSHKKDPSVKMSIGSVVAYRDGDEAVWFKSQLSKSARYISSVKKLIEMGLIGYSTGADPQRVTKSADGTILDWPVEEVSLTVQPAEPMTLGLKFIKEIDDILFETGEDTGTEIVQSGEAQSVKSTDEVNEQPVEEPVAPIQEKFGGITFMTTDTSFDAAEFVKNWKATSEATDSKLASLSATIDKFAKFIEASPALMGAGFVSQDGGTADKNIKSFSDFLISVRRRDTKRLGAIYKATKDLSGESGATGGYILPVDYSTELQQLAATNNVVLNRVQNIPVGVDSGRWPALDQYITPTPGAGQVAESAGVTATPVLPGQTLTKTEPGFEMLEWRLHKVGGYTEVDNELIDDSPTSIEALLKGLFAVAIGAKNERNILRGSGVGEPLGILNSSALIQVTPATNDVFGWADVGSMWSRYRGAGGSPVWLIHPSIWPDIMGLTTPAGASAWSMNLSGSQGSNLNGFPILTSEHLPQANNSGCVLLVDLKGYITWTRSAISIDFSEHAAFRDDQGTWRFTQRIDGKPWLKQPITLADPQGSYSVSPFISFND
jgi:HK97 family phage major capsid protein